MTAGTEGFSDTTGGQDSLGSIVGKILAARRLAQEERQRAEDIAEENQTSLAEAGIGKGFFFKAALGHEFGGNFVSRKKEDLDAIKQKATLLKDPKNFWDVLEGRGVADIKKRSKVERFRDKLGGSKYGLEIDDPSQRPQSAWPRDAAVPDTEEATARAASGRGKRVTREDILAAISKIADALERTAQSISQTAQENSSIASNIVSMQENIISQISERTNSIEDKLDAIAEAIKNQTSFEKQTIDKAEDIASENRLDNTKDVADTSRFDDVTTKSDDLAVSIENAIDIQQESEMENQSSSGDTPEAETGGIISGPDSGYNVKLHGDEMIIPLNNAFTDPRKPAVTEKGRALEKSSSVSKMIPKKTVAPKQSFEIGTVNPSSTLGGKVGISNMPFATSGMTQLTQTLMDATSLLPMVAGGYVLSATTKYMNTIGPEHQSIAGEISKIAAPIADVFGLPNTIANKAKDSQLLKRKDKKTPEQKNKDAKKQGMFGKMMSVLAKIATGAGSNGRNPSGNGGAPPEATNVPEGKEAKIKAALDFYKSKGLSDEGASYMVGNLLQESGLRPDAVGDNGKAFGLAQWRIDEASGARWVKFKKWAEDNNKNPGDFNVQLEYTLVEGETYNKGLTALKGKDKKAIMAFIKGYEGYSVEGNRFGYGEDILRNMSNYRNNNSSKPSPSSPGASSGSGQSIVQNYGMKTGQEFSFTHNGKVYKAHKTAVGFEFFDGMTRLNTNGQNLGIVQAFIRAKESVNNIQPPASANKPSTAANQQAALRPASRSSGGSGGGASPSVAVINNGAARPSSGTSSLPTSESQLTARGTNLHAYYNPNPVAT